MHDVMKCLQYCQRRFKKEHDVMKLFLNIQYKFEQIKL